MTERPPPAPGDVCQGSGNVCSGTVYVDYYGPLRSGRPGAYDFAGVEGVCPPVFNASDPSTVRASSHLQAS